MSLSERPELRHRRPCRRPRRQHPSPPLQRPHRRFSSPPLASAPPPPPMRDDAGAAGQDRLRRVQPADPQGAAAGGNVSSALPEDCAPSVALDQLKAQLAPTHPGARPGPLGGSRWVQQPASGRLQDEGSSPCCTCRSTRGTTRLSELAAPTAPPWRPSDAAAEVGICRSGPAAPPRAATRRRQQPRGPRDACAGLAAAARRPPPARRAC